MRKKRPTLIVSFSSTIQAIRMEAKCKETNTHGRIIPVPGEISAGCGLAWSVSPEYRTELQQIIETYKIDIEAMTEILF